MEARKYYKAFKTQIFYHIHDLTSVSYILHNFEIDMIWSFIKFLTFYKECFDFYAEVWFIYY